MTKPPYAAALCASFVVFVVMAASAPAAKPAQVAVNRCNAQTVDDASRQLEEYDRHPPRGGSPQLVQRYGAIEDLHGVLNEERDILDSICADDAQRAPLFLQIAAFSALALVLESDIAATLNASCPGTAKELATMMLADAWLALANVVNERGGTPPAQFTEITVKVQRRAAALGLRLPSWGETSTYWRDQVRTAAKTAIKKGNCE